MARNFSHTGLGIALGIVLGAVVGVMAGHIAIWLGVGIVIGMVLGATLHRTGAACPECALVHRQHQAKTERAESLELTAKS